MSSPPSSSVADRGIAHAIALQLHARGDHVIAACLADGDDLKQQGIAVEPHVDVTDHASVTALAARLRGSGTRLDWLLHVAGVLGTDELGRIDYDDVRRQFEINTIGPLRTVEAHRDLLGDGAKVGHRVQPGRLARRQRLRRHVRLPDLQGRREHGRR